MPRTTPLLFMTFFLLLITLAHAGYRAGEYTYDRKDYITAFKEWQPLAEQDQALVQFNLGLRYLNGQGVPQDYAQARNWWLKAAAQGHAHAQLGLGTLYALGQGVPQDFVQAHMWSNLAAAQIQGDATKLSGILIEIMTLSQIAEAQRLAREWQTHHQQ